MKEDRMTAPAGLLGTLGPVGALLLGALGALQRDPPG